jgi:hypothetical protein
MVLGLHILAIILGGGDCGDGSGIHSTLQLIFSPNSICRSNVDVSAYQLFSELGYVVFVSYLISILVFIYKTLSKSKDTVIL